MEPSSYSSLFYTEIIGFIISLLSCSLFSFLETSVTAVRLFKLEEVRNSTKQYNRLLRVLEKKPHEVLSSILIANSVVNVTAAALITDITEKVFTALSFCRGLGFSCGIALGSFLILLFGEILPKNIAKTYGNRFFKSSLWITNITFHLLYPLVTFLSNFSALFIRFFGGKMATESVITEREIKFLIEYTKQKGIIDPYKTQMLHSIFDLSKKQVREIMIPIIDVIMIKSTNSLEDVLRMFSQYQYSRLPVYDENKDNVIGMLYLKDIFPIVSDKQQKAIRDLVRPILFVPESMKISQLLTEFKQKKMHIAMVISEHGNITGLVTLEDALEEIVGEIQDEYEEPTEKIVEVEKDNWLADGAIDLETLEELLSITFKVEDAITLGGFLTEKLQHLPKKGERVLSEGYVFQIQNASKKRVIQVLIFKDQSVLPTKD